MSLARVAGRVLAALLRALAATWRVDGVDAVRAELARRRDAPLLVGFWHGEYFPLLALFRGAGVRVFAGEGTRGRLIDAIARSFELETVLLPHGDPERAVARMREALAEAPCATAFDGPLGPARQVKPALVRVAAEVGATLLPVSTSARPRAVLGWRWDRREIPLPFARVQVRMGEAISVPAGLGIESRSTLAERVGAALDALERAHPRPSGAGRRAPDARVRRG